MSEKGLKVDTVITWKYDGGVVIEIFLFKKVVKYLVFNPSGDLRVKLDMKHLETSEGNKKK
jgi:hypothetical protein